jgi:hypothetical protein
MEHGTMTIASNRAEPLTNGACMLAHLGFGHFTGVAAQDDMNLVRPAGGPVQEIEQPLGIKRATCASNGHDKFHGFMRVLSFCPTGSCCALEASIFQ